MHAQIFICLSDYVRARSTKAAAAALEKVIPRKDVLPFRSYPDALAVEAVTAVANAEGRTVPDLLVNYGRYFVQWAKPSYTTAFQAPNAREFLKSIGKIHALVTTVNPNAEPPSIRWEEPGEGRLVLHYGSPRHLCPVVRGMIEGVANEYREEVRIQETACMHRGHDACRFELQFR